jgi:hypothetical protein
MNGANFAVDIETVGTAYNSVVLGVGIVPFRFDETLSLEECLSRGISVYFNVDEQTTLGRTIDDSTVDWWRTVSKPTRQTVFNPPKDQQYSLESGLLKISDFVNQYQGDKFFWDRFNNRMFLLDLAKDFTHPCKIWSRNNWFDLATANTIFHGKSYPELP